MGWWRSLLPCGGADSGSGSKPPGVATFWCCCCCCGRRKQGMHDEEPEEATQGNEEKNFVFLENYPTEQKIVNPSVPFCGELPVALYPGRIIIIQGTVKPQAIRMSVNLACGSGSKSDLAFHLNPRFEQNLVVRNYRLENHWGVEETSSVQHFPFKRGHQFQMQIFTTEDNFLVAFNGEHFCSFAYRLPLVRIQMIQVNGDVEILELEYKNSDFYPLPYEGVVRQQYDISSTKSLSQISKKRLDPPLTAYLLEGLPVGSEIEILGRVKLLPQSFYVNLQAGVHVYPHPQVALHINPRFRAGGGVIQNAWVKGKWGAEKKTEIHQFRAGRSFSLKIASEEERYAVSIDGASPAYFVHRCSPDIIDALYIQGDLFIKDIRYLKSVRKTQNISAPENIESSQNAVDTQVVENGKESEDTNITHQDVESQNVSKVEKSQNVQNGSTQNPQDSKNIPNSQDSEEPKNEKS